jgi:hypothetical protein
MPVLSIMLSTATRTSSLCATNFSEWIARTCCLSDLNAIPSAYKHVALTMPTYVWEALLVRVSLEDRKGVRVAS